MNKDKTMYDTSGITSRNKHELLRNFMFIVQAHVKIESAKEFKIQFIPLILIIIFISFGSSFGQSRDQVSVDPIHWNEALEQDAKWYKSSEAIRIADNVLLYQHPTGGWPKNINMAQVLSEADKDSIRNEQAAGGTTLNNITIDNGATYTQMRYLASAYDATEYERFREAFLLGVDYLLEAQYANGGWPQYYPIRKGYSEHITFNDNAMIGVMSLLKDISDQKPPYTFIDNERKANIAKALDKGLDVILETQIKVNGTLMAWCTQYDKDNFTPAGARSYEHPSISGSESVNITRYLMQTENPSPRVIEAVESAVKWFEDAAIHGKRLVQQENPDVHRGYERFVVDDPNAPPIWARFYEIETNLPIFSGRDGIIKYHYSEIEHERQVGYSWFGSWPLSLLEEEYPKWRSKHNLSSR
ncbi:pectate lyase [Algoriphagus persicinus]|uniref:pectate lyase n=1 Tax=Algoriphagus persicinus TaxID=3108754 RepID=UPI002B3C1881|nr:pectate lyase [Algoriphagus sp. E1-3-M2]MEB2787361.1 pectate lyase [Algoriphagus sp. E1-3-M2]